MLSGYDHVVGFGTEPMLFVGGGEVGDVDLALVQELSGNGRRDKAVVEAAGSAIIDPGIGAAHPTPAFAVTACVEPETGVGVVAPIAIVALVPQGFGHKFADDAQVEAADLAYRHLVEF